MAKGLCARCDEPTISGMGYCRDHANEAANRWYNANRDLVRERRRRDYAANREKFAAKYREANWRLKLQIVEAYGGKCDCCGITEPRFLSIDHVNGGGYQHRQAIRKEGVGGSFYAWLRREGFPQDGYRLLCFNCNLSSGFYGSCPHNDAVAAHGVPTFE